MTGLPIEIESKIGSLPVQFSFRQDPVRSTIAVEGFQSPLTGVAQIPDTPAFSLPAKIELENGSMAEISCKGEELIVKVDVREKNPRVGKVFHEGSCVELFLDDQPFRNLDLNATYPLQFYGTPTGGKGVLKRGKAQKKPFEFQVRKTASGYQTVFRIPVQNKYLGVDLIVTRGDGTKERIKGIRGMSFKERFHYPLIRTEKKNLLKNGDFEQTRFGDPDFWFHEVRFGTKFLCEKKCGYIGNGMSMEVTEEQKVPTVLYQRIEVPAGKYRHASGNGGRALQIAGGGDELAFALPVEVILRERAELLSAHRALLPVVDGRAVDAEYRVEAGTGREAHHLAVAGREVEHF